MKRHIILSLGVIGVIIVVFRHWFLYPFIIGGDWPFYYDDYLRSFSLFPVLWAPWLGGGLGSVQQLLGLHFFGSLVIVPFTQWFGIGWNIVYKVGWFGLFIALSVFGSKKLWEAVTQDLSLKTQVIREMFPWWVVASLVYTTNTYILMVTGGGQMGVALAYSLAPIVLASFIKLYESVNKSFSFVIPAKAGIQSGFPTGTGMAKSAVVAGLALGAQLMIDPRIAYVTMAGVSVWVVTSLLRYFVSRKEDFFHVLFSTFFGVGVSVIIAALLNAFLIVPMVMMRSNPIGDLGSAYTSIDSIKFYSFADFSHALSLLHPNWPENVFGKTFFLQSEFLMLPILAFASVLFLLKIKDQQSKIFYVVPLALAGAFFAKGAQEPFGEVYLWMFEHIPGFVMFRDPTKWYVLIVLSYSILIPWSFMQLSMLISSKQQVASSKEIHTNYSSQTTHYVLLTTFLLFWLFTIRPAVLGKLGGTFAKHEVPLEYRELEDFLHQQPNFARTLWVPRQQRFSYGTLEHMPIEAEPLFRATTAAQLRVALEDPAGKQRLEDLGIGYIMVPYDSLGELFLTDRKYDGKKRQEYETVLDRLGWLTKIRSGHLTVYQVPKHRDLFWISTNESIAYRRIRTDQYGVSLTVNAPTTVYFSQTYHPGWVLRSGNMRLKSERSSQGLNSFQILTPGSYEGIVEFEPQKYVTWGAAISILTILGALLVFLTSKERRLPV